jgi:hypothetical protein
MMRALNGGFVGSADGCSGASIAEAAGLVLPSLGGVGFMAAVCERGSAWAGDRGSDTLLGALGTPVDLESRMGSARFGGNGRPRDFTLELEYRGHDFKADESISVKPETDRRKANGALHLAKGSDAAADSGRDQETSAATREEEMTTTGVRFARNSSSSRLA